MEARFSRLGAGELIVVPFQQFVNCDRFLAVRACPTDAYSGARPVAVAAPLLPEIALVAFGAGVDGDFSSVPDRRGGDRTGESGGDIPRTPRRLSARRGAVDLPPDPAELVTAEAAAAVTGR